MIEPDQLTDRAGTLFGYRFRCEHGGEFECGRSYVRERGMVAWNCPAGSWHFAWDPEDEDGVDGWRLWDGGLIVLALDMESKST
jgi:hypothetical protein